MTELNQAQCEATLQGVAAWMGRIGMTDDGSPVPTGRDAAYVAAGPMLVMDWEPHWGDGSPRPTILLEGGPYDWPSEVCEDEQFQQICKGQGVFAEPLASYALGLYPR